MYGETLPIMRNDDMEPHGPAHAPCQHWSLYLYST